MLKIAYLNEKPGLKQCCLGSIVSGWIQWNWIPKWFVTGTSKICFSDINMYIQYFSFSAQEKQSIDITILIVAYNWML